MKKPVFNKYMVTTAILMVGVFFRVLVVAQDLKGGSSAVTLPDTVDPQPGRIPFAWGDFTWIQGNSRQSNSILSSKYFTGSITLDCNYNYSFNRPIDHTTSGSTATLRCNEFNISYIEAGGEFFDPSSGIRAKLLMQFGTRATGLPVNDLTPLRGQYDLHNALRYIAEGFAGFHINKMYGINIDAGLFKSFMGLLSYNNFENWNYQPSFTSDHTPWYFTGLRIQAFPSDRLKLELWLVNGWQTYAMFNERPGLGGQVLWRPTESISILSNYYAGWDTPNNPHRLRFHTDNSMVLRYCNEPEHSFISKAALSLTVDFGFEQGGGVVAFNGNNLTPSQNYFGGMVYHRVWLCRRQQVAWTMGAGYFDNPGRYLALLPPGNTTFTQNPGDQFSGWDFASGLQFMPNQFLTLGLEWVSRHTNVPYFSGQGGVTSPNGWNPPIGYPNGYEADLVKDEKRIIFSATFKM